MACCSTPSYRPKTVTGLEIMVGLFFSWLVRRLILWLASLSVCLSVCLSIHSSNFTVLSRISDCLPCDQYSTGWSTASWDDPLPSKCSEHWWGMGTVSVCMVWLMICPAAVCMYVYVYVCACLCVCMCMSLCVCVCTCCVCCACTCVVHVHVLCTCCVCVRTYIHVCVCLYCVTCR